MYDPPFAQMLIPCPDVPSTDDPGGGNIYNSDAVEVVIPRGVKKLRLKFEGIQITFSESLGSNALSHAGFKVQVDALNPIQPAADGNFPVTGLSTVILVLFWWAPGVTDQFDAGEVLGQVTVDFYHQ
jgi:hypothetical protein